MTFDQAAFGPRVLEKLKEKLGHDAPFSAEELAGVTGFRVSLSDSLFGFEKLTGLKTSVCRSCEVEDLSAFTNHRLLRTFNCWYSSVRDLSALATCPRSEEHTSELQSRENLVCRLLLEKKKIK